VGDGEGAAGQHAVTLVQLRVRGWRVVPQRLDPLGEPRCGNIGGDHETADAVLRASGGNRCGQRLEIAGTRPAGEQAAQVVDHALMHEEALAPAPQTLRAVLTPFIVLEALTVNWLVVVGV
jgi:hypothetical protein